MDGVAVRDAASFSADPITLEVIRHGVVSISNQVDANITRTAFSPYIYEYKDFSVGLLDATGQLVAQSTGSIPIFVADSVAAAVRDGLLIYGPNDLNHGDVIVCNHAAVQGQHLNNTVMYTPICAGPDQALIGFFAINAHWIDIGGGSIGSSSSRAADIFGEGLQLRTIKLWHRGKRSDEVYRIIENNTRLPLELMGDIAAQLAGCFLGRDLVAGLAAKYGIEAYLRAIATILDDCEAATRARLSALPDGIYAAESFLDNDGLSDTPIPVRIKVVIDGDRMIVDYSDVGAQTKGPINSGFFGGGQTAARVALKYMLGTEYAANEGMYRPLEIVLPAGKFLSAAATAPMGHYSTPLPTVIDTILKALSMALPDGGTAAHFGSFSGFGFKGRLPESNKLFRCHDSAHGGWGACSFQDGAGPFRTMAHGDTRIIPVELQEASYPFRIDSFELREDSGGAGKFRGGLGTRKSYRVLQQCTAVINFERIKCPPWGIAGGMDGMTGRVTIFGSGDAKPLIVHKGEYDLAAGSVVRVESGGGGGYGDPKSRATDQIEHDLEYGYISAAAAERDYGLLAPADEPRDEDKQ